MRTCTPMYILCEKDPVASNGAIYHRCFGEECTYPHHQNRGSTELHGHKFAVCHFLGILSCFGICIYTNLQSVIFWEFYPVLVYAFTGPPLGLLGEL